MAKKKRFFAKKRQLDLECLAKKNYAVVSTVVEEVNGSEFRYESAIQMFQQANADVKKIKPELSHCDVIVEFSGPISFKLVVPAISQGALFSGLTEGCDNPKTTQTNSQSSTSIKAPLEASSLQEAEQLATRSAAISMPAIDHGNALALRATKHPLSLEEAMCLLAKSPDENISRKIYVRARGPERTIRYATGSKTIGGGHQISAFLHSKDTYVLKGCRVLPTAHPEVLQIHGSPDDPEWQRLRENFPGTNSVFDEQNQPAMEFLHYASGARGMSIDVEVCISEKVDSRKRRLFPIRVLNQKDIISQARERLDFLEEISS